MNTQFPLPKAVATARGPFVGTRPFSVEDSAYFFGREREATRLANMVAAGTLTVLYGESGVGKSSLVNARLPIALNEIEPDWQVITFFEWQVGCEERLNETVARAIGKPFAGGLAKALLGHARHTEAPILLALDQFEEYFLYHPKGIASFEAELAKLVNLRTSPIRVLLSLRSDGLFLLDRLRLRIPDIFGSMMLVEPLDAKAAVECVVSPIEAFNEMRKASDGAPAQVPNGDSALVRALIAGAEEEQIRRRLPSRGRGEVEQADRSASRVVAPFLQMALEALWEADVIEAGRSSLEIGTLRQLAGLGDDEEREPSSQAVGLLAQRYVDNILKSFKEREKSVCALVFERMVMPSGQKVAVRMVDLRPVLQDDQEEIAKAILRKLSQDQKERLIKMVAPGPGEIEPHYQIVHDAMAVPILGWIEQWRQEQRAAAEREAAHRKATEETARARRQGMLVVVATLVFGVMAVVGSFVWSNYSAQRVEDEKLAAARAQVQRLSTAAARDTRSEFRLPLLLTLASMAEAARIKDDTTSLVKILREKLLRAPRDGGTFAAAALDAENGMFAWLDTNQEYVGICSLKATKNCSNAPASGSFSSDLAVVEAPKFFFHTSANRRLRQGNASIGFVAGFKDPVIYRQGMIYHRRNNTWHAHDLALLAPDLDSHVGFVAGEIVRTGIKVMVNNWPANTTKMIHLSANPEADQPFSSDGRWRSPWWRAGNPAPVISSNGALSAFVYASEAEESRNPDAQAQRFLTVRSLKGPEPDEPGTESSIEIDKASVQESVRWLGRRPGVGFSEDNQFFAAIYRNTIRLFDVGKSTTAHEKLTVASRSEENISGAPFSQPPLAIVNKADRLDDPSSWRFGWSTRDGVHVVDRVADGTLRDLDKPLLAGTDNAARLVFSKDGAFLMLQAIQVNAFGRVAVRVWDLSQNWKDQVNAPRTNDDTLRALACHVAAIDRNLSESDRRERPGNKLSDNERQDWGIAQQPCP